MKLTTALAAVGLLATSASAGFFQSCEPNWTIVDNILTATCKKANGQPRRTQQDMNLCLRNNNGQLVAQDNGGFRTWCYNCGQGGLRIVDAPYTSVLMCMCKNNAGKEGITQIDLGKKKENPRKKKLTRPESCHVVPRTAD